ncbi:MAG: 4Fe-4S binding protein [Tissierellia bacterium]|nr:4Fe-4S binding protein [Tissierellia bacterium]
MKIAVLSGKGGAGKTLVSVNLAYVAGETTYIDCDVEEPNGHLFFQPREVHKKNITVKIPKIHKDLCNSCKKCVDFCKFNALAFVKDKPLVFDEICHSCGGCLLVCPQKAITEEEKVIGRIEKGKSGDVEVFTGILNTGEPVGVPIINALLKEGESNKEMTIIDCPPGSSCSVMESIEGADYCILVAEPTIFGTHNLKMVYELVKLFNKAFGVVLNKSTGGENPAEKFCLENDINIIGEIPYDNHLGSLNSDGKIVAKEDKKYYEIFSSILDMVFEEVGQ